MCQQVFAAGSVGRITILVKLHYDIAWDVLFHGARNLEGIWSLGVQKQQKPTAGDSIQVKTLSQKFFKTELFPCLPELSLYILPNMNSCGWCLQMRADQDDLNKFHLHPKQTTPPVLCIGMRPSCWQGRDWEREKWVAQNSTWWVAYAMLACQYPCSHVHKLLSVQFAILHSYMPQYPRTWPYATGLACWSTLLQLRMTARSTHMRTHSHTIVLTDGWKGGPRHVWSEQRVGGC